MIKPILLSLLVLTGCASVSKPVLPEQGYTQLALNMWVYNSCAEQGNISTDTAANGLRHEQIKLNGWSFNKDQMTAAYESQRQQAVSKAVCTQAAIAVAGRSQQTQQHNQVVAQEQQAWNDLVTGNKNKQTTCNKIGTQIFCSTN